MTTIFYTLVDESPALATYSFLPIIKSFTQNTGISIETKDISLAGRIIAAFPDYLPSHKQHPDDLATLGELTLSPDANIIKLPNISASIPQLKAAIAELQSQGYPLPMYPDSLDTISKKEVHTRYTKLLGSAVNPILREGNSDRRAPKSVKNFAKTHPHRMGEWNPASGTHVSHMEKDDFYSNEQSLTLHSETNIQIEHVSITGNITILKPYFKLQKGEIIDATFMNIQALRDFFESQLQDAKAKNLLFSLHLKATMMKVSDPIIFGHALSVFFQDFIQKHTSTLSQLGFNPNNGLQDLMTKVDMLPENEKKVLLADMDSCLAQRPALAMVNSEKGITNLHIPSDVIVDASMPAMIRDSGQMWNAAGLRQDTKAVIPDQSYAQIYQVVIDDCKAKGAFNPSTMGSVSNVGLMAQQAEEYGSHDKTFCIPSSGRVRVIDDQNTLLFEHKVNTGDIWRLCQTKDAPIQDWIKLAVTRAKLSQTPAVFWLDPLRSHDQQIIQKVTHYLKSLDTHGLDIRILSPKEATQFSLDRLRAGQDTISVTGNVLRDYNTDLFPILEVGTSAKMLSIVPLMNGGGLFETGAGGSAPKLAQQFFDLGHLRWDSLGEFLALEASLEHVYHHTHIPKAKILADTLDVAIERYLNENKGPGHDVGSLDTRGTHFYLALFWAQSLSNQAEDRTLKKRFITIAEKLTKNESIILKELTQCQGKPNSIGGYYHPDPQAASDAMRPSLYFNEILLI